MSTDKLPSKGWKTYVVGVLVTAMAFLNGADWGALFTPETAGAIGAGIVFGRAIVGAFQAAGARRG